MEIYRELFFKGTSCQLKKFVTDIQKYATGDWHAKIKEDYGAQWLEFEYTGKNAPETALTISLDDNIQKGSIRVNNIFPLEDGQITISEYNTVLIQFYNDVVKPYKATHSDVDISQPTDDVFDPTTIISEEALDKLRLFCNTANKTTGSAHPLDQRRWFDFICQTVDDDRIFDAGTLATFLQDESFWGKRSSLLGAIGNSAWDKRQAEKLAIEYENACEILTYYKETRLGQI